MIVKKMKNKEPNKSKSAHISDTLDYIMAVMREEPYDKLLYIGTHNLKGISHEEIKHEMTALAELSTKSKNPMQHIVLSLRREDTERVTEERIRETTRDFLSDIGYSGCQTAYAVHQNTNNIHIHIMINRIDPETHTARSDSHDLEKMHQSIAKLSKKYGWSTEDHDRYVIVDDEPMRARYIENEEEIIISDRAIAAELHQGAKSMERIAGEEAIPIMKEVKSWQELHDRLALIGFTYERKGGGAVLKGHETDGKEIEVKASSLARWASLKNMEKKLGIFRTSQITPEPREPEPMPGVPKEIFDQYQQQKSTIEAQREAAYKAFTEEKAQLAKERKEALQIIQRSDIDWTGKGEALAALQKASKELYKDNCEELFRRYQEKVEKDRRINASVTNFEIWMRHNCPEREREIVTEIERAGNKIIIPGEPVITPGIQHTLETKIELFQRYHNAIQAERYRITCVSTKQRDQNGKPLVLILDKDRKTEITRGYTPEEVVKCIGLLNPNNIGSSRKGMSHFEQQLEHVYFTPLSDNKWHFFIDDLDPDMLYRMRTDGLSPACIIETSRENYQAIFTLPKIGAQHEDKIINDLARGLNLRYGDVGFCGSVHAGRAPGFWNVKEKYRVNDSYPIVNIVEATGNQCEILKRYSREIAGYYVWQSERHQEGIQRVKEEISRSGHTAEFTRSDPLMIDVYNEHRRHAARIAGIDEAYQADQHILDAMVSIRLRGTGHTEAEIEQIILVGCRARGREKHDLEKYAQLTASYAYSPEADAKLYNMRQWIGQWKQIENRVINEQQIAAIVAQEPQQDNRQSQKVLELEREIEAQKQREIEAQRQAEAEKQHQLERARKNEQLRTESRENVIERSGLSHSGDMHRM